MHRARHAAYRLRMAYATRPMHDADSHIMEPPDVAPTAPRRASTGRGCPYVWSAGDDPSRQGFDVDRIRHAHADPEYRAEDESQIMLRKNFLATGSFIEDRPAARARPARVREPARVRHVHELARSCASNATATRSSRSTFAPRQHRAIARLVLGRPAAAARSPSCRVGDMAAAVALDARSDRRAARPRSRSASTARPATRRATSSSNRCGRCARRRVCRSCCTSRARARNVMNPAYFENGLPPVPDFHGGDTNFKSIDYMSIPLPVMQTLNALVIDGVLQRHPDLRIGVIELGASWIPGWMRMLDSAHEAFRKNEERLQNMEMKPSEYVQRQVRATPYPHEDTGWTIANTGAVVCMFSSDFPHVEGGRNPIGRFERSMDAAGIDADDRAALLLATTSST